MKVLDLLAGLLLATLAASPAWADTAPQKPLPSAANQCGRTELTQLDPVMTTHRTGAYPIYARHHEQQGRVYLRVVVDGDGLAGDAVVVSSSGYSDLDYAAAVAVKGKWRWKAPPAECRKTGAIQGVAIDWNIGQTGHARVYLDTPGYPADAKSRETGGSGEVQITVGTDHAVTDATVTRSTGSPELDEGMVKYARLVKIYPGSGGPLGEPYTAPLPIDFIPAINPENIETLMGPPAPTPAQ